MQLEELIHAQEQGWTVDTPDGPGAVNHAGRTRTDIRFFRTGSVIDYYNEQIHITISTRELLWHQGHEAHTAGVSIWSSPFEPQWGQVARWWVCGWQWAKAEIDHKHFLLSPWLIEEPPLPPEDLTRSTSPKGIYQSKMF